MLINQSFHLIPLYIQSGQVAVTMARNKVQASAKEDIIDWKIEQERHLKNLKREAVLYNDFWSIVRHKIFISRHGCSGRQHTADPYRDVKKRSNSIEAEKGRTNQVRI